MKTIGVITNNLDFFQKQKDFFFKDIPLHDDTRRAVHGKEGTRMFLIRPDCIEMDSCSLMLDVLVFEFPTHLPRNIE